MSNMSPFGDMKTTREKLEDRKCEDNAVWRALADPLRREILDQLVSGPKTTGDLVATFSQLSRTAVMKHLDLLVAADLVLVRREGRLRWNSLNPVPIEQVCQRWVKAHVRPMASAITRLKRLVEADVHD